MCKKAFAFVLAFVIAAASIATLAGCGKSEDKNKKTTTTAATKAPTTAAATEGTDSGENSGDSSATEAATVVVGGDQSSVTPDPSYSNSSGNYLVDAVLNYTGLTSANGYYGQVYGSYTSNGVTYYSIYVFNSTNAAEGMWYISSDGSTIIDSVTFYNQYIAPDYDADPITADDETPTYYISPNGPDNADAGDYGADNTVAPYED